MELHLDVCVFQGKAWSCAGLQDHTLNMVLEPGTDFHVWNVKVGITGFIFKKIQITFDRNSTASLCHTWVAEGLTIFPSWFFSFAWMKYALKPLGWVIGLMLPSFDGWSWERDSSLGILGQQWVRREQAHMGWVRSGSSSDTGQRCFVRKKPNRKQQIKRKNRAKNRAREWWLDEASPNYYWILQKKDSVL